MPSADRTTPPVPTLPKEGCTRTRPRDRRQLTDVPPSSTLPGTLARGRALDATPPRWGRRQTLLRKEVIQPHLPVRLPCYDFVPIASPTFDDSPPQVG